MDSTDGLSMSKVRSDESVEVTLRHTDRILAPAVVVEDTVSMSSNTGSDASLASADVRLLHVFNRNYLTLIRHQTHEMLVKFLK